MITLLKYCCSLMFWVMLTIMLGFVFNMFLGFFFAALDCYGLIDIFPADFWEWTDGFCS